MGGASWNRLQKVKRAARGNGVRVLAAHAPLPSAGSAHSYEVFLTKPALASSSSASAGPLRSKVQVVGA